MFIYELPKWIRTVEAGGDSGGAGGTSTETGSETASDASKGKGGTSTADKGSEGDEEATRGREGGVEALRADLVGERKARQAAEKAFADFQKQITDAFAALTGQKQGDTPLTVESLGQQLAEMQTRDAERETQTRERVIRSEVRGAAKAAGFHDPADALARIDLTQVPFDNDGVVDTEYIAEQLKTIAEKSPYLVGKTEPDVTGLRGSGTGAAGAPTSPGTGQQRIAAGLATSGRSRRN